VHPESDHLHLCQDGRHAGIYQRLSLALNVGIAPLLVAFAAVVIARVAAALN